MQTITGHPIGTLRPGRLGVEVSDDDTNDFLTSELLRRNETRVWILSEQLRNNPASGIALGGWPPKPAVIRRIR